MRSKTSSKSSRFINLAICNSRESGVHALHSAKFDELNSLDSKRSFAVGVSEVSEKRICNVEILLCPKRSKNSESQKTIDY